MSDILSVLKNKSVLNKPPVWLMRQAGRYLPEYRELRAEKGSFLNLVYSPKDACEVTMQPIRRYQMDGAILFSDILIIPHAIGLNLEFKKGEGPVLDTIQSAEDFSKINDDHKQERYNSIYETVSLVREQLRKEQFDNTSLIGFAGAPWTVACYIIQGHGKCDFPKALELKEKQKHVFEKLIDYLIDESVEYLSGQIEAGAQAIKIFESWANLLEDQDFDKYCYEPIAKIRRALKKKYPDIPVIAFAKTDRERDLQKFSTLPDLDCMALSHNTNAEFIKSLPQSLATQGYLDPQKLLAGGQDMEKSAQDILDIANGRPHIFNLGHGVIKETPPENVEHLIHFIRGNS